ncbi:MAG TPA: penicillin-binding protein activator [Rhizomicrobium sp.]|nr:penicillin-binding protein activator [Rhizomicrobium sp.]
MRSALSFRPPVTRRLCVILGVLAIGALTGCVTEAPVQAAKPPPPPPQVEAEPPAPHQLAADQPSFLRLQNTGHDVPVRVGILLPFSNGSSATRALANAMLKAAELAMSDADNPNLILMPADEGATPDDAANATRKLLGQGAEIIVGPLFAASVTAVTPIAKDRGVPVLAFSTDRTVAKRGIYLLSFQPENEVRSVVAYAAAQGHKNFAALVPENAYGNHVADVFREAVIANKGQVTDIEKFVPGSSGAADPTEAVARTNPDAILIAQGGPGLRAIASILATNGPDHVQLLGTGVWDDPSIAKEPALGGGLFAAPPPHVQDSFDAKYRDAFDATPPQLATLAYDAISLVALLAPGEPYHRFTRAALVDPNGFAGVDGIFRFNPDGTAERGLAILSVTPDGFEVVHRAPQTFEAAGE